MQGEAIGEVAVAGLARAIHTPARRRIANERDARHSAIAGEARGIAVAAERRGERA